MDREARRNAYRYCMLRDQQFSLYDAFAKRNGMTAKSLMVVNALFYAKDGITQRDIAARVYESKQAVNLVVKRLVTAGHAEVSPSAQSGREKTVTLTNAGRACYESVIRHVTWAEDKAMSLLSSGEQEAFVGLQRRFTEGLTELMGEEPRGYREKG